MMFWLLCGALVIFAFGAAVHGTSVGWSFGQTLALILLVDFLAFALYFAVGAP